MSHPMWVRGLKLNHSAQCIDVTDVAPYVGAWIETLAGGVLDYRNQVAPYVGAWIETTYLRQYLGLVSSHPMWVRGLKLIINLILQRLIMSHPMWVRGLKQHLETFCPLADVSHPMWVRGLKLKLKLMLLLIICVAPYVGAWIETAIGR